MRQRDSSPIDFNFPGLKESYGDHKFVDVVADNTKHGSNHKEQKISYHYIIGSSILAGTV
jgi:hypothetical protein